MICSRSGQGWELVRQPDHGVLACALLDAIAEAPRGPLEGFRLAVAHHDDGWAERDRGPRTGDGEGPESFLELSLPEHLEISGESVRLAGDLHPYAEAIVALHGAWLHGARIVQDPDLAEQHFGEWQGLTYVEIAEKHANNHLFWLGPPEHRPPGGESFVDLRDRTVRSIDRLTEEHRGRDIVATAHGGTIRAALAHAFDLHPEAAVRFEIDNVSVTMIEHFEQADPAHAWRVAFVNYMPRDLVGARAAALA